MLTHLNQSASPGILAYSLLLLFKANGIIFIKADNRWPRQLYHVVAPLDLVIIDDSNAAESGVDFSFTSVESNQRLIPGKDAFLFPYSVVKPAVEGLIEGSHV